MKLERCGRYLALAVFSAATVMGAQAASAASTDVTGQGQPVLWLSDQKSTAWVEELMGQVLTYQTLADKQVIEGNYQPYLDQMIKVRNRYRAGDRRATYDGVNQFMTMLEVRMGGVDEHSAEALWNFCYRVTPDEYHARDRHVRAKGEAEVNKEEEFLRDMEERASLSF
ncbi:Exported protein [Nitrospira japonica]|uniref:Exported protein n=1 Tax=Nitrospira japonica TaxID=1325564 RepID=A0A1W1I1L0_9BACT|nr:hypothetical protein [Nitrospira japonica]SLM46877.1 Exported protein [Nitrospira japonica]